MQRRARKEMKRDVSGHEVEGEILDGRGVLLKGL